MRQHLGPVDADHRRDGEQEDESREERPQPGGETGQRQPDEDARRHETGGMAAKEGEWTVKDVQAVNVAGTLSRSAAAGTLPRKEGRPCIRHPGESRDPSSGSAMWPNGSRLSPGWR
jgi:hypothetical protein